jgi:hypothetical protein
MASHKHLLNLAEIRATLFLHCVPERQVYARDDKDRMALRYFFDEGDQFRFGGLAIKYVEIGKNHA